MTRGTYTVQYGETTIAYDLDYGPRKTLAISVEPNLRVSVTAPEDSDPEVIAAKVRRRAPWILRQQRELEQYLPQTPPRQYVSGETHRYLGRQYRLKVAEEQPEGVKLTRGWLYARTSDRSDAARVKELLDSWYYAQALRVFPDRLQALIPRFLHAGVTEAPELLIRRGEDHPEPAPYPGIEAPYRLRHRPRAVPSGRAQPQLALLPHA